MTYLSACAIFKNEAAYLDEWLTFHRLMGVEHFFLYNNFSTDEYQAVLYPHIEAGLVTLHDWFVHPGQASAYLHCLSTYGHQSRWLAFIDIDEFLFSPTARSLPEILIDFEEFPAVGVNWATYGSSGHVTRPPGLIIEVFLKRAANNEQINSHVKSIVQGPCVSAYVSPHHFLYRDERLAVNEQGLPINGPFSKPVSFDLLRINHYWCKSQEEYANKVARGRADIHEQRSLAHFHSENEIIDVELDPSILGCVDNIPGAWSALAALRDRRPVDLPVLRKEALPEMRAWNWLVCTPDIGALEWILPAYWTAFKSDDPVCLHLMVGVDAERWFAEVERHVFHLGLDPDCVADVSLLPVLPFPDQMVPYLSQVDGVIGDEVAAAWANNAFVRTWSGTEAAKLEQEFLQWRAETMVSTAEAEALAAGPFVAQRLFTGT